jgi:hypothetical protein
VLGKETIQKWRVFQDGIYNYLLTNNPIVEFQNRKRKENPGDNVVSQPRKKLAPVAEVLGTNMHSHWLIEKLGKKDTLCHFCNLRGVPKFTIYGCVECKKGYHVNCFTAYHCAGALTGEAKILSEMIIQSENDNGSNHICKVLGTIEDLKLPVVTEEDIALAKREKELANAKTKVRRQRN